MAHLEAGVRRDMSRVEQSGRRAAGKRLGYAAKGIVYIFIGFLAAQAAFGAGGAVTDQRGAILTGCAARKPRLSRQGRSAALRSRSVAVAIPVAAGNDLTIPKTDT